MIKMIEQQTSSGLQGNTFIYLCLVINPNPFFHEIFSKYPVSRNFVSVKEV